MTGTVIDLAEARRARGMPPVNPDIDAVILRACPDWLIGRKLLHIRSRWRGWCLELRCRSGRWEGFILGRSGVGYWLPVADLLPDGGGAAA